MICYSCSFGFFYLNNFDFGCLINFLRNHLNSICFGSLSKNDLFCVITSV